MKKNYFLAFIFLCLFFNQIPSLARLYAEEPACPEPKRGPFTINVCSYRNGVGLDQDMNIMVRELTKLGHIVGTVDYRDNNPRAKVDINIFIEVVNENLFQYAHQNYFIPNPEWCFIGHHAISRFDKILCKTQETLRIFKQFNPNSVFMSFTSEDRYDPLIAKDYTISLHLAGASIQKNSREVAATWLQNPHFPVLNVIKHQHSWDFPPIPNIRLHYRYFNHKELVFNQIVHGFHICTSGMEGFGHYIMEGLGCAAVVVTIDAPPMNEFVKDKRCLVPSSRSEPRKLANHYFFEPPSLKAVMENLYSLPTEELKEIGRKNREFYLENDRLFKEKLVEIFSSAI